MKAANIGLIFLGGYHTEGGLIVRQARQQGLKAVLMGGDSLVTNEYWAVTGAAGEGTLMTFGPDPSKIPEAKPLVNRFLAKGYKPEGYTLNSYAILQIFQQAVTKLGAVKSDGIIKILHSDEFNTVVGKIRFDAKGDVQGPGYVVYEWHNGNYDYVK
jgi:branched-chain amino acid transport system substrate-binding protein